MRVIQFLVVSMILTYYTADSYGREQVSACSLSEYQSFDFWIGEWEVFTVDGKKAGENSIKKQIGGCVLHERYKTAGGYTGESFNIYDATRNVWHQTWVDSSGLLLQLEGNMQGKSMVLMGVTTSAGRSKQHRIVWTPNADDSVRQLWQSLDSDGKWIVVFDGRYVRKQKTVSL